MNLELLIAQCVMVAAQNLANEHSGHFCGYLFLGQLAHNMLHAHYIEPPQPMEIPRSLVLEQDMARKGIEIVEPPSVVQASLINNTKTWN